MSTKALFILIIIDPCTSSFGAPIIQVISLYPIIPTTPSLKPESHDSSRMYDGFQTMS